MQIRQLQVVQDTVQDRLMLRVATQGNEELRVWFTRRFLREIWPHLATMLATHLKPPAQPAGKADNPAQQPSFEQPFRDDNVTYPLGATPLLASESRLSATTEGSAQLTLKEGRERSFNLNLNGELLQALCAMLRVSAQKAGWDLPLEYGTPAAVDTPAGENFPRPGILH